MKHERKMFGIIVSKTFFRETLVPRDRLKKNMVSESNNLEKCCNSIFLLEICGYSRVL